MPIPYTQDSERVLHGLADLDPRTIATHHGSAFVGNGNPSSGVPIKPRAYGPMTTPRGARQ